MAFKISPRMVSPLVLLVFLCLDLAQGNVECMSCQGVTTIVDCLQNKITCGPAEKCFLEKYTSDTLESRYNAGCRSATVCTIMASVSAIGRKRDLVNCAECCDGAIVNGKPCNSMLCGQKPNTTTNNCLLCNDVSSVSACTAVGSCQDTQVCWNNIKIENNFIRYSFGCEERHLCEAFYKNNINAGGSAGRRSNFGGGVSICDSCCIGEQCNREDCFALFKQYNASSFAPLQGPP